MATAALIDLDGTLVDTLPDIHAALAAMCAERAWPQPSLQAVRGWVGKGSGHLVQCAVRAVAPAADACDNTLLAAYLAYYRRCNGQNARLYPGVSDGLAALADAGVALACVTNKPEEPTFDLLAHLGIASAFAAVIAGRPDRALKPAPDLLHLAAEALHVPIAAAVMVGDSQNDLLAARAAGCACLLVPYGYSEGLAVQSLGADAIVPSLLAACEWIQARGGKTVNSTA